MKAIGVRGSISTAADPAFALDPEPASSFPSSHDAHLPTLLALRAWKDDALGRAMAGANFSSLLGGDREARVTLVPMHLPEDADYMTQLLPKNTESVGDWRGKGVTPAQVMGTFTAAELVVSMRLHALIFAARCATPFIALSYDPKVKALARAAGQEDALLAVESVMPELLKSTVEKVRATAKERRHTLGDFAETQRSQAKIPAQIAARFFE